VKGPAAASVSRTGTPVNGLEGAAIVHIPSAATEKISVGSTTKKADETDDDKPNDNDNNKVKNGDPPYAGNVIIQPDQQPSRSPDILVDAPSPKIEDDVQADVGLVQKRGVKEDSKAIIDLSVPIFNSLAPINGLDNNPDEAKTNGEIKGYFNNNHHINGVVEDEEEVDSKAEAVETEDKGQYVGNGSWEEKTWKELVRLREDMFWARLGGFRG
jgi:hypothetical protein